MGWKQVFFGFQGRIPRSTYWLGGLAILVYVTVMMIALIAGLADADLPLYERVLAIALPLGLLSLPTIWAGLALAVKRLHDRGKSGWWVLLYYWAPGALDQISRSSEEDIGWIFSLASLVISVWAMIDLGFRRGTAGPNQYGPDPLNREPPLADLPPPPERLDHPAHPDDRPDRPDAAVPITRP